MTYNAEGFYLRRDEIYSPMASEFKKTSIDLANRLFVGVFVLSCFVACATTPSVRYFQALHELSIEALLRVKVMDYAQPQTWLIELPLEELLRIEAVRVPQYSLSTTELFSAKRDRRNA